MCVTNAVLDPQIEAALFREEVLKRFHERIEQARLSQTEQVAQPSQTEPPAWDAEMELWAFASST